MEYCMTTPNIESHEFDYEIAYHEMRNIAAFVLNVIAGEINDGLITLNSEYDKADLLVHQKKIKQVLKITGRLYDRAAPANETSHFRTLEILSNCMIAITAGDPANVKHFGGFHDSRFPD